MIRDGDVGKAGVHLGRPYMIEGTVIKGDGRGRTIGFPTINLKSDFPLIPKRGVYISMVEIDGKIFAVTNIGYNPTFDAVASTIETHFRFFSGSLWPRDCPLFSKQNPG